MVYSVINDNKEEFNELLKTHENDCYAAFYAFVISKVSSESLVFALMDTIAYDCDWEEALNMALPTREVVASELRQDSPF